MHDTSKLIHQIDSKQTNILNKWHHVDEKQQTG